MENNIILHDFVLLLRNKSKTQTTPQFYPQKCDFFGLCNQNMFYSGVGGPSFRGGSFSFVTMEGEGHVFSNHHISKYSGPPPSPFFLTSP